ncbi:MAG: hypothetical protein IT225_08410 [Flavobacteriales bacterium]|nr:hypothetical protein [Flavobacteriales bacterium]
MAKHPSPDHGPDPPGPTGDPSNKVIPPMPHEDEFRGNDEVDETAHDPEHARRLAAVRTELFRRAQAERAPEE